MMRQEKKKE